MNHKNRLFILVNLLFMGSSLSILFLLDILVPVKVGILLLFGLTIWGLLSIKTSTLSLLPRLAIILYSLPFSTTIRYLFDENYIWLYTPARMQYLSNQKVISQMIMIGMIGLLGLLTGINFASIVKGQQSVLKKRKVNRQRKTLPFFLFFIFVGLAVFLSWIYAPKATIFEGVYAQVEQGSYQSLNFASAPLMSYIVLIFLYIDAEREQRSRFKRIWKFGTILIATAFIVIYLQLLRGDRECLQLIIGLTTLYLTGPEQSNFKSQLNHIYSKIAFTQYQRLYKMLIPLLFIFFIFISVGIWRYQFSIERPQITVSYVISSFQDGLEESTWTYVLLTNLGMAGLYNSGQIEFEYGGTYWDYLLSLPPGILTKAVGIERPLESYKGPNWWYGGGISLGGNHIVNVPFKNFGILGTFVIVGIFGFILARWDKINTSNQFGTRLMYGSAATSLPMWFWYGDMNIIRGLMIAFFLGVIYRIIIRIRFSSVPPQVISKRTQTLNS